MLQKLNMPVYLTAKKHFLFQPHCIDLWIYQFGIDWGGLLEALVNISHDLSLNWSLSSLTDDFAVWRNVRCEMKAVAPSLFH